MTGQHNLDAHVSGALHDGIEILNLKPEQHAVAVRFVIAVADCAVMVLHLEAVQLKHKLAVQNQLFIGGAAMIAAQTEQALIPPAACFYVGNGDERLGTHSMNNTAK